MHLVAFAEQELRRLGRVLGRSARALPHAIASAPLTAKSGEKLTDFASWFKHQSGVDDTGPQDVAPGAGRFQVVRHV